jgi:hypothetical protein
MSSLGMAAQLTGGEGGIGVDVGGEEFLAGAGFADEEDADVAFGGEGGLFDDFLEGGGGADHARRAGVFLEALVFLAEGGLIEGVADGEEDAVAVEGLFEEIEGAGVDGLDGVGDGAVAGDHDDGSGDGGSAEFAEEVYAGGVREADIEEEKGGEVAVLGAAVIRGAGEGGDGEAFALQDEAEGEADIGFVVNDPDFFHEWVPGRRGA